MGKCVLFDLDGTLIDSGEGITKGVEYAVEKFGKPALSLKTRQSFIGPSLREMFKLHCGVNDSEAEEMLRLYREYYGAEGLYRCVPYEGIEDVLKLLSDKDCSVYVATAKPTEYAEKMLKKWDLYKYFKKVIGASFDKSKTEKKDIIADAMNIEGVKNAIMVGDTCFDIEGAKENGIESIGVTYGYGDIEKLKASKPDYLVDNTAQLLGLLRDLC